MEPTKMTSPSEENPFLATIKRGFLLWSWIGLLGAYTSTSAVYGSQLITIVAQGVDRLSFSAYWTITVASLMFPIAVLMMGWLLFSRYSRAILSLVLVPETEQAGEQFNPKKLGYLFNASIMYLIYSWVAILLAVLFPYMALVLRGR